MKKKILLVAIALMMFMGVVNASSFYGTHDGNEIVRVKSGTKLLQADEVPAMIYNGHTLVPISMLRQLGASVEWDQNTYSVDVKLPQSTVVSSTPNTNQPNNTSLKFAYNIEMFRYIYFINEQAALSSQIISAMNWSSNSQIDNQRAVEQISRIATDLNTSWTGALSSTGAFSEDVSKLNGIKIYLDNVKNYLLKFDTSSANSEWALMKVNINDLYAKYDQLIIKDNAIGLSRTAEPSVITPVTINQPPTPPIQQPVQAQQQPPQEVPQNKMKQLSLYSNDGKVYLGKLTSNEFDSDSIYNEFGKYGSQFQSLSIFNEFGTYGGEFSSKSPFNQFSTTPPIIVSDGKIIGYLTLNSFLTGAISPLGLKEWLKENGY